MPYPKIDLKKVHTYPIAQRRNLVTLNDLIHPSNTAPTFEKPELLEVVHDILKARQAARPVIWMMGAHVVKCGLNPLIIDLMEKGMITHIGGNGAVSIHDTELAMIGETSEDVATSIEDGSFGMAHETGAFIHQALKRGVLDGLGYGEALGKFIAEEDLPHKEISVLYNAYRLKIPFTIHSTIGADIIHQHPDCDFGILGEASGRDFLIFCASVAELEQGVFLNFGSAVTGAEVFLKAISITRNQGFSVSHFTTANFDLFPLKGDVHANVGKDNVEYYYRPRKNIVNRPVSMGGRGFHIQGNHLETIPSLHALLCKYLNQRSFPLPATAQSVGSLNEVLSLIAERSKASAACLQDLLQRQPTLQEAALNLGKAYLALAKSLERGGFVFISGNGGSMADALHISGEMLKSYAHQRPLGEREQQQLQQTAEGSVMANHLERGLRAIVLGINPAFNSAVENDFQERNLAAAQELNVLARTGDVFIGISTSGKARNLRYALEAARAKGLTTIIFTGPHSSPLAQKADIAIHAPGERTDRIQENHILLYHCLCEMLELDFFSS